MAIWSQVAGGVWLMSMEPLKGSHIRRKSAQKFMHTTNFYIMQHFIQQNRYSDTGFIGPITVLLKLHSGSQNFFKISYLLLKLKTMSPQ